MGAEDILAGGRLTINLGAVVANWRLLAKHAAPADCGAVVKADAYGCGIEPVVAALNKAGCSSFFVALVGEGVRVKSTAPDAKCFVLNGLFPGAAEHLQAAGLIPVLSSMPEVEEWSAYAKTKAMPLPCALQIDSGMTRLGLSVRELERVVSTAHLFDHLDVQLFMTHFACADDIGHPKTDVQREVFEQASTLLPGVPRSAANSAADLQANGLAYDLARPGIALYAGEALNDVPNPMQTVATLEAKVMLIRKAYAGDTVGYGACETLKRNSRIAYVSVGYADGYNRASSNMGVPMRAIAPAAKAAFKEHIINGVGRVSMDMCAFDVTDIPEDEINPGDWIELFGTTIPVDDVARASGTIGYELLTGLGHRYVRKYLPA